MNLSNEWQDYELLDAYNGLKIERWGKFTLVRPDPEVIWTDKNNENIWKKYDAFYHRSDKGGGSWEYKTKLPDKWQVKYKDLVFNVKTMGFKHTGIFPEQATNWEYMINKIKNSKRNIKVLNLFAYTGGATLACLYAGASVVHLDSSKGMVDWAKENVVSSHLNDCSVRFIVDDVIKFAQREIRRGNKYDAIIMDPPSYGRGADGEIWDIEKDLYKLLKLCEELLSDNPLFLLINSYTTGLSKYVLEDILKLTINKKYNGIISSGEVGLPIKDSNLVLPCGIYGRWEDND